MLLRPLACLAAFLSLTVVARADEAADRHAAALDLMSKMHITDNMSGLGPDLIKQVQAVATRGDPTLNKQFDTFSPQLSKEVDDEKKALLDQIADIYTKDFTADELKQMSAFYQTPLGQKITTTQSRIAGDVVRVTREWGTRVGNKLLSEARVNLQSANP